MDIWCLLFWVQFLAFIVITIIFAYQCFYQCVKVLKKKNNEIRVNEIRNAIDSTYKDMIIKRHEEDLDLAYKRIKELEDEIEKLKKRKKSNVR